MVDFGRIQKELREIESDKASGVAVDVVGDNLQTLTGAVPGPKDTPYDGGLFRVAIELDDQYPFVPPRMRFMTRVWHPNVSSFFLFVLAGASGVGENGGGAAPPTTTKNNKQKTTKKRCRAPTARSASTSSRTSGAPR